MNTEKDPERNENEQVAESTEERPGDSSHGSKDMYETERKNAGKLIGIERRQYAFIFVMLLVGVMAGMFLFGVSYQVAAVIGGIGALALIFGVFFVPRDRKSGFDGKHE